MKKLYFLLVATLVAFTANAQFDGGDGTMGDPYQIANGAQLKYLADNSNLWTESNYYIINNDIDMTSTGAITPIGYGTGNPADADPGIAFGGVFNGNNKVITNLVVTVGAGYGNNHGIGLFGAVSTATITNLGLVNPTLGASNMNRVGAFVGQPRSAVTINNCFVDGGTITSNGWGGSFVGASWSSVTLTNSWSNATVIGGWSRAGLVGNLQGGTATFTNVAFYGTCSGDLPITLDGGGYGTYLGAYYNANGSLSDDQTGGVAVGLTTLDNLALYVGFDGADWEIDPNYNFAILSGFLGHSTDLESDAIATAKGLVFVSGKTLYVKDVEAATSQVKVYNLSGVVVAEDEFVGSEYTKTLDLAKGLYIVKVGTQTTKVMVK